MAQAKAAELEERRLSSIAAILARSLTVEVRYIAFGPPGDFLLQQTR